MKINWKRILGLKQKSESQKSKNKKEEDLPKELRDKLPEGVKVKQIVIGPEQVIKFFIYLAMVVWVVAAIRQVTATDVVEQVSLSQAMAEIKKGDAKQIMVSDNDITIKIKDSNRVLVTQKEPNVSLTETLQRAGIDISQVPIGVENHQLLKMLGDIATMLLTIGLPLLLIVWLMRKSGAGGGMGGMFGFGKSPAKLFVKGKQKTTFKDVAGVTEAKKDLEEIVDFLKNPDKYLKMGARVPKGVLLVGPSGVGKTLLAKAVAGEANVAFFSMAGSEFMEMLVGVGASRARDLFATAKKAGRAIVFIDEIDAIGRMRGGIDGGHGEREQTLNQILVEMDGFEPNTAVVVLAATNRADLLDPALMRPGRFDRRVVLEMPDLEARREILKIHARGKPFGDDVDWEGVARRTVGFSGADLENLMNEAAIAAARQNNHQILMADIDEAAFKVKLGAAKKRSQTDEDKKITAYHEAGHAVVNYMTGLDPVTRVSIVSRGMALGFTFVPPERDRLHMTKSRLMKQMMMAMGGRAAEEMIFGDITTGAASDISHATNMARNMVVEWGMSELGPVNFGPQLDEADWGKAIVEPSRTSDKMLSAVDDQIKALVNAALEGAKKILKENKDKLDKLAAVLMEKETIDQVEFAELMG